MKINNKLGIYSFFGFRIPLIKKLRLIKEAGFSSTTLWWGDEYAFSEINKDNLANTVRKNELYLENIHLPYSNINNLFYPLKSKREKTLSKYLHWIEDCAQYEIPMMVMHITDGCNLPEPGSNLYNSYKKITYTAEEYGIIVAVENTQRHDYIDFVLKEIKSEYLGFCYDSSHDNLHNSDITDILKRWKHRLKAVHLSDNDGKDDRHFLPSKGNINWDIVCKNLDDYRGIINLETFARVNNTPENFLKMAFNKAKWLKSKIDEYK